MRTRLALTRFRLQVQSISRSIAEEQVYMFSLQDYERWQNVDFPAVDPRMSLKPLRLALGFEQARTFSDRSSRRNRNERLEEPNTFGLPCNDLTITCSLQSPLAYLRHQQLAPAPADRLPVAPRHRE